MGNEGTRSPTDPRHLYVLGDPTGDEYDPDSWVAYEPGPLDDSTASAGSGNAASIDLGQVRSGIDVFYDVGNDTDAIVVEVSQDQNNWRELARVQSGDLPTGGEAAFAFQGDTAYRYARAYATNAWADADINTIEIVGAMT